MAVMVRRIAKSHTKITVAVIGAAAAAASAGWLLSSCGTPAGPAAAASASARQAVNLAPATGPATAPATAPAALSTVPAARQGTTVLATVRQTAPSYASAGQSGAGPVPASWYGRPSVLPVIATRPGWVQVRLAQRPNGSTAWLPAIDVTLGSTPYRIVVNTATAQVALYDQGRLVFSAPAGVGTPDDPTPTGEYFVAFDEQPPQPNPGYGPFIMVTSAHSPAISDWEGSGDAVIGIHGPLGEDSEIGTTGARISHGCIRLHDQALKRLTEVPPGTPIDVVS
jgi:lipoprotein-anchoring transpeptidase ErfK/SrfK